MLATPRLGSHSEFSATYTFATIGAEPVRAELESDTDNIRSDSPSLNIAVGAGGIHKIQHIVIITQENRSFDQYFGTYPGADGIRCRG